MARIADKHGLTNKYRPIGSKRVVKRGRPRKHLFSTGYRKPSRKTTSTVTYPSNASTGKAGLVVAIVLIFFILIVASSVGNSEKSKEYIDFNTLQNPNHPVLFDSYESVKDYYRPYDNTSVGSYQSHPEVDSPVVTALSYLQYDFIYLISLNLENLHEKLNLTLNDAIDLAISYVPLDIILEYYDFEQAIYKKLPDGALSYECYYVEKNDGTHQKGYYSQNGINIPLQNGFSLVITETTDGNYTIDLGDDWYGYKYDTNPVGRIPTTEEELATHMSWDFRLEKYAN